MDHLFLLITLGLLSTCFLFFFTLKSNKRRTDDIKPYPILGHLPQFLKNRRRLRDWIADSLAATPTNTMVFHRPGNMPGIITANPANIEHALRSNFSNFPKGPQFRTVFHDLFGNGMFTSDGHAWKAQRKAIGYEFNTHSFRSFVEETIQLEAATRLLPLLNKCALSGQVIDLQDVLERFAFDNICRVGFNEDPASLSDDQSAQGKLSGFADAFRDAAELSAGRFRYAIPGSWKIMKKLGVGSERRLRESIATVHEFVLQIIRLRIKEWPVSSKSHTDDMLSRLILLNEDHSEEFLRDMAVSFILAGRETTSSALTWFFWQLSSRSDVQQMILNEIASVRARSEKYNHVVFEFDDLREMQYLHAAITESMRLYPPVPANVSVCQEDDVLPDGTEIKKGWFMSYQAYAMGRMESVWGRDCRDYKPERWLDDAGMFQPESPFKFLAFHAGPRMCLGKEMAYIQMKSIAATVLERFVVEVVEGRPPVQSLSLTLRMKGGLAVRIKERQAADSC